MRIISDWICKNIPPENVTFITWTISSAFLTMPKRPKREAKVRRKKEEREKKTTITNVLILSTLVKW